MQSVKCSGCQRELPRQRAKVEQFPYADGFGFSLLFWCPACFYDGWLNVDEITEGIHNV